MKLTQTPATLPIYPDSFSQTIIIIQSEGPASMYTQRSGYSNRVVMCTLVELALQKNIAWISAHEAYFVSIVGLRLC